MEDEKKVGTADLEDNRMLTPQELLEIAFGKKAGVLPEADAARVKIREAASNTAKVVGEALALCDAELRSLDVVYQNKIQQFSELTYAFRVMQAVAGIPVEPPDLPDGVALREDFREKRQALWDQSKCARCGHLSGDHGIATSGGELMHTGCRACPCSAYAPRAAAY